MKYYTEAEYAKKKENKKFWKQFRMVLKWILALVGILVSVVGILCIVNLGYQQADDYLNKSCNQPIGSQQPHKMMDSELRLETNWDSSMGAAERQSQTSLGTCSEIGSIKVTNKSTSRQPMIPNQP